MKGQPKSRALLLYALVLALVVLVGGGTYFFIVRPNEEAGRYMQSLQDAATVLHRNLAILANTTQLNVFNNSDGSDGANLHDLGIISASIATTRKQIASFKKTSQDLPALPHINFFNAYHNAQVSQQHAMDIVSQTNDVLAQYDKLADFLKQYFTLDKTFVTLTSNVNAVGNLDTLIPISSQIYADGQAMAKLASGAKSLQPPPGYASLLSQASAIYNQAAQGFNALAYDLTINYDPSKNTGITQIEQATNQHDNTLIDTPSALSQNSYILTQVNELPDKTDSIISAKTSGD